MLVHQQNLRIFHRFNKRTFIPQNFIWNPKWPLGNSFNQFAKMGRLPEGKFQLIFFPFFFGFVFKFCLIFFPLRWKERGGGLSLKTLNKRIVKNL